MDSVKLTVLVEVSPTEDQRKVETAVQNLFSYSSTELTPRRLGSLLTIRGEGKEALGKFYNRLREERILSAARRIMLDGFNGDLIIFHLNKQAAYARHISFSSQTGESPLGVITVEINSDKPKEVIDWLTPRVT